MDHLDGGQRESRRRQRVNEHPDRCRVVDRGAVERLLGDVMFFGESDPEAPFYSPAVDDPATVGVLADALTAAGFAVTAVEMIREQVGVLVAERAP